MALNTCMAKIADFLALNNLSDGMIESLEKMFYFSMGDLLMLATI
jgi:hypothetical protein